MPLDNASIEDLLSPKSQKQLGGSDKTSAPSADASDPSPKDALNKKIAQISDDEEEQKIKDQAPTLGFPYINLTGFPVGGEALQTIPENICQKERVICFLNTGDKIRIGSPDPTNPQLAHIQNSLAEATQAEVKIYVISERNLNTLLAQYAKLPKYKKPVSGVEISEEELDKFTKIATDFKTLNDQVKKVTISELVTLVIAAALQAGSSDIHIEAEENDIKVRLRVDGVLHDAASIEKDSWNKIISRIKLLSGLKINITDHPQDGRFTIKLKGEKVEVRVSTVPTTWGESVVMRLLKSSAIKLDVEKLGLQGKAKTELLAQIKRPNGMIISTGPTGSGKTTMLYAMLTQLNTEGIKILTLEDPIEYKLAGINQSQIDHSKGYSFADGLKSMLRQDPDIMMVGEIRDLETAEVAINSALTGHLVISTIHTNSASGAVPRFLALGVKPFLLAPALNALISQRLVRLICPKCKTEALLDKETREKTDKILKAIPDDHPDKPKSDNFKFYIGKGCDACQGLGYKGRIGIFEVLILTPEIKTAIQEDKISEIKIQGLAIKNGMLTMVQDGLIKALAGLTSVEEVFRVSE